MITVVHKIPSFGAINNNFVKEYRFVHCYHYVSTEFVVNIQDKLCMVSKAKDSYERNVNLTVFYEKINNSMQIVMFWVSRGWSWVICGSLPHCSG